MGAEKTAQAAPDLSQSQSVAPSQDSTKVTVAANRDQPNSAADLIEPQSAKAQPDSSGQITAASREGPATLPLSNPVQTASSQPGTSLRDLSTSKSSVFVRDEQNISSNEVLPSAQRPEQRVVPSQRPLAAAPLIQSVPQTPAESQKPAETLATEPVPAQATVPGHEALPIAASVQTKSPPTVAFSSEPSAHAQVAIATAPVAALSVNVTASATTPAAAEGLSSAAVSKNSSLGALRSVRGAASAVSTRRASPIAVAPSAAAVAEATAVAAGVAGARGGVNLTEGFAAGPSTIASPEPRETFEALDSESAVGKPAWVHAGARRAEAGFEDPSLGWVGVRAESGGGRVHAEVVSGSSEAAQALSGHLAGLNAYLAEHHAQVDSIEVTAAASRLQGAASERDTGQAMQQRAGEQMQQQMEQGSDSGASPVPLRNPAAQDTSVSTATAFDAGTGASAETDSGDGTHISVMA